MRRLKVVVLAFVVSQLWAQADRALAGFNILGPHQNGGKGCVGCHTAHRGGAGAEGMEDELWGDGSGPVYQMADGAELAVPAEHSSAEPATGVMLCVSCHDGQLAKAAMVAPQTYEQALELAPAEALRVEIPTLREEQNGQPKKSEHPVGPSANLAAVGLVDQQAIPPVARVHLIPKGCVDPGDPAIAVDCILPNPTDAAYLNFIMHYGSFNVTMRSEDAPYGRSGARHNPLVIPDGDVAHAYVICTTCHSSHALTVYKGSAQNSAEVDTYRTSSYLRAPYNPEAFRGVGSRATSATQFCRQCHFSGEVGSNEGSGIWSIETAF